MNGTSHTSLTRPLALIVLVALTFAPAKRAQVKDIVTTSKQVGEDRAASIVLAQGRCVWDGRRWICF